MLGLVGPRAFLAFSLTRLWILDSSRPFALLPGFDLFLGTKKCKSLVSLHTYSEVRSSSWNVFLVYVCLYVCPYVLLSVRLMHLKMLGLCQLGVIAGDGGRRGEWGAPHLPEICRKYQKYVTDTSDTFSKAMMLNLRLQKWYEIYEVPMSR